MRIRLTSVIVNDQEKAFKFYTEVLGFEVKLDIPMGDHRWLTLVSRDDLDGVELLLEPLGFEPAKVYQKALYDAGIPLTAFHVPDLDDEYERMRRLGVSFSMPPTPMGPVMIAVLDDTCGNRIQLVQVL